jgi:1,4-alpha-glucan branching enzyme
VNDPDRAALRHYMSDLGRVYRALPCFWHGDPNPESFEWIDFNDRDNTVMSFMRRDSGEHAVVIFNFTPVPRANYRIGAPEAGRYRVVVNSDDRQYGGSGHTQVEWIETDPVGCHGRSQSFLLTLPPLAVVALIPERVAAQLAPGNSGPSDGDDGGVPTLPTGAGQAQEPR